MVFLRSLIVLVYNIGWGFLIPFSLRFFLFLPEKPHYFSGKKLPLTPGLIPSKKEWLINKLHALIDDYLNACRNHDKATKVAQWEEKAYKKGWELFGFIERARLIPRKFRDWLRHFFSMIIYELAKQFLRSFIPYLMEHYRVKSYIEIIDQKLDVEVIRGYYDRYIYRYMLYVFLGINFLIGLGNMIIFLIVH